MVCRLSYTRHPPTHPCCLHWCCWITCHLHSSPTQTNMPLLLNLHTLSKTTTTTSYLLFFFQISSRTGNLTGHRAARVKIAHIGANSHRGLYYFHQRLRIETPEFTRSSQHSVFISFVHWNLSRLNPSICHSVLFRLLHIAAIWRDVMM